MPTPAKKVLYLYKNMKKWISALVFKCKHRRLDYKNSSLVEGYIGTKILRVIVVKAC